MASMPKSLGRGRSLTRVSVLCLAVGSLLGGVTVLSGAGSAGASGNLYVSPYGSDSGNPCTGKAHPCLTLQHAYNVSTAGSTINLAGGTYKGGLVIDHNLNIVGTSSGGSLEAVTSTISRGGGSFDYVLTINSATVTISNVVIDGANGDGGGLDINAPANVTLNDVNVVNNISNLFVGAGIENNSTLVMNGGSISNNSMDREPFGYGGGLSSSHPSAKTTLNSVSLTHDTAFSEGGAILLLFGQLKITGATAIHDNSAGKAGGGIEKCPGTTLQIVGTSYSNTANTPDDFSTSDPTGVC
jgi:hypothetical protein